MRFASAKFWKHRGDCCDFFEVVEIISDDGETAEVKVAWHTQMSSFWVNIVPRDQFRIMKREYHQYQAYSPRGDGKV